jgi:vancomycin resistance protein YoaR
MAPGSSSSSRRSSFDRVKRTVFVLAAVAALAVVAALGAAAARVLEYRNTAKPGVRVLGADLGGRDRGEVEAAVTRAVAPWLARVIEIQTAQRAVHVRRGDLVRLDAARTVDAVMAAGSTFSFGKTDVAPVWRAAPGGYVGEIARHDRAPVSASVDLVGSHPVVRRARPGLRLDSIALLRAVKRGSTHIDAAFVAVAPAVGDRAARSAAATARLYLDAPIGIDYHGARRGALTPPQLARGIEIRTRARRFAVVLDPDSLARLVRPRLGKWIERARNARFVVRGDLVSIVPSAPGRDVDPHQVAVAVSQAAHGDRVARIELAQRDPDLTTGDARALRISRKLVSFTTEMGESSSNRIHNVHLMADFVDGTVIRPGEEFSFNRVVGPRTEERGFLEGQMIVGSLLLPSIGGGVCQTATTLFNDAFELGLPILERHNHNLYISHYPTGRDATVSWGGPDLRFRNDMKSGLLIKAAYTDTTLTFTFYGTSEHRRVLATTTDRSNFKPAVMQYALDPRAPRGSVKVETGSGAQGFDVTVYRTVLRADGKVLRKNTFLSRYVPEGPTTIYGPGRTPPRPYYVIPET